MQRKPTHHNQTVWRLTAPRQAFTLVELLVVSAVIGILAVLTLIVMGMVTASTKNAKTRTTIQKIDTAMQQIWTLYESEFAVIKAKIADEQPELSEAERQKLAAHFIRDLLRMEMPQNQMEVQELPVSASVGENHSLEQSPLLEYYQQYDRATNAALLFLIIQNLNPEALEAFHGSEVAPNEDGMLMFVDAWGNPIQFLRWAPAFPGSDVQFDVLKEAGDFPRTADRQARVDWWDNRGQPLLDAMKLATERHSDPMDERVGIDSEVVGWFLYPLIYSAGPDGNFGIIGGDDMNRLPAVRDGILDPFVWPFGMPTGTGHFDNIHNHRWYNNF